MERWEHIHLKKHTKIYLEYFGYTQADWIPCEMCGSSAVDIHHIKARGMGGSKKLDVIENLMALCRECHVDYGDQKQYREELRRVHARLIDRTNK
jgi:5-methylcytosine-specific restriction endonuclease McrA